MSNLTAILGHLEKLKSLPWKGFLWLVAGSFIAASLLSSLIGEFIMPEAHRFRYLTKVSSPGFDHERPSLNAEGIQTIIDRNIFNIEGTTGDEEPQEELAPVYTGDEAIATTLPLKLVGTIFGGDPFSGIALIEDTQKKQMNSFFVGDMLSPDAKIVEIYREKIFIDRGDHREFLALEEKERSNRRVKGRSAPIAAPSNPYASEQPPDQYKEEGFERSGTNIVVSSDFRKKLLTSDFAKVLQDAKAEPHLVNGELAGFRLTRIRQDSIYQKAGLQNGDVIKEINGVSLVDTAQAIKLLNSLRGENAIEVRLDRGGQSLNINMQVR